MTGILTDKKLEKQTTKIQFCQLCGGSGLIEKGNETDTCPLCKGERTTPKKGEAIIYDK